MVASLKPADPGDSIHDIETPALILDLDLFEENLRRFDRSIVGNNVRVRPHAKSHKCPAIARIQIDRGAIGVCCQKTSEAEIMVANGITDVLISNQVVTPKKILRIVELSKKASVSVLVDNPENVSLINDIASKHNVRVQVLIELNVGANRCGVTDDHSLLQLAKSIQNSPFITFIGIHAYQGRAQHVRNKVEREALIRTAIEKVLHARDLLESLGFSCDYVTGAGTGTYEFEAASGIYSEIQPGSYIFMDADYSKNLDENQKPVSEFLQSLFVLTTVMSTTNPKRPIVDAGLKSLSVDSGLPLVSDSKTMYVGASDEHGVLESPDYTYKIGDTLRLIPGHCDPTVNLYDWIVCVRGNKVEDTWPILARGASI